jgi:hypothetical protein
MYQLNINRFKNKIILTFIFILIKVTKKRKIKSMSKNTTCPPATVTKSPITGKSKNPKSLNRAQNDPSEP